MHQELQCGPLSRELHSDCHQWGLLQSKKRTLRHNYYAPAKYKIFFQHAYGKYHPAEKKQTNKPTLYYWTGLFLFAKIIMSTTDFWVVVFYLSNGVHSSFVCWQLSLKGLVFLELTLKVCGVTIALIWSRLYLFADPTLSLSGNKKVTIVTDIFSSCSGYSNKV